MPTPTQTTQLIAIAPARNPGDTADWRCSLCEKLLGVHRSGHLHIKFARGAEYSTPYPVVATCRVCSTLNRTSGPPR